MIKYMNENEERIIRAVSDALIAAGWKLHSVDDGGDHDESALTIDAALDVIDGVETSWVWFERHGKMCGFGVILFNGNDGKDCVYDWNVHLGFDSVIEIAHDLVIADIEAGA